MRFREYPSVIDTGIEYIGYVPKHWDYSKRLRHIFKTRKGKNPSIQEIEMKEGYLPYLTAAYLRGSEPDFWVPNDGQMANEDDILLLWDGSNAGEFFKGKLGIVGSTFALLSTDITCKKYFWYLLKSYESYIKDTSIGMGIPHVNGDALKNLLVLIPSLSEQKKIVDFLDDEVAKIDELIQKQEKLVELSTEKRQALINNAVTKGLKESNATKTSENEFIGNIPSHWSLIKLGRVISSIESGKSVNAADTPVDDSEVGVLKTSCVYSGKFNPLENKAVVIEELHLVSCPVRADTLIVSRMNTPDLVGAAGYVIENIPNIFLPDRLWQISFNGVLAEYAYYWTLTNGYRAQVKMACAGTSSSMQNLSQEEFKSFVMPLAPIDEQRNIVSYLRAETLKFDILIAKSKKSIELLKEHRTSLISAVVTGKVNIMEAA